MPTRSKSSNTADASIEISDFVRDALDAIVAQVRERTDTVTGEVADQAAKAGTDAVKRVMAEVEQHPLTTLAVAAGIGFLIGAVRR